MFVIHNENDYVIIGKMKDTYYSQCIRDIETLIQENKFEEAYAKLSEELSMPYIPQKFLIQIEKLESECRAHLKTNEILQTSLQDPMDILNALKGNEERQIQALDSLSKLNLRQHIDVVHQAFALLEDRLMLSLLIRILIEQALAQEFRFKADGMDYVILPVSLCLPEDSDGFEVAEGYLEKWCEKEPSLYHLALQELHLQTLLKLPIVYDAYEGYDLALEIMEKTVTALYDKEVFEDLKKSFKQESKSSSTH